MSFVSNRFTALSASVVGAALCCAATVIPAPAAAAAEGPVDVKVLVFTMFSWETKPWLENEKLTRTFTVNGAFSPVWCTDAGLCVTTTGMGKSNAALSAAAVLADKQFDLSKTVFLTAGIAGVSPEQGTLGSAAWADWIVDFDLGHHILPTTGTTPDQLFVDMSGKAGTEVYKLNPDLVSLAYDVTKDVALLDGDKAKAYRTLYPGQEGQTPKVIRCDTVTGDNYWHGAELSNLAKDLVSKRTGGAGKYCSTQMEDNAVASALARTGYLDRYVNLRTMSNFDQPHPGQTVRESLDATSGGFPLSIENEYRVGSAFARHVLANRDAVLTASGSVVTEAAMRTVIGGKPFADKVLINKDRSLVPAAALAEALGAKYQWQPETRTVRIEMGTQVLELATDRKAATVGGQAATLAVGARLHGGQPVVPLRFVAESLGFQVTWDEASHSVQVLSK